MQSKVGEINEAQIETLIRQYLKSKNYENALSAFEKDAPTKNTELKEHLNKMGLDAHTQLMNQIFLYNHQDTNPTWYFESFDIVHSWVHGSLDSYREELETVLWCVFVNFYVDLIMNDNLSDALAFFSRFENSFRATRKGDLDCLRNVNSFDTIQHSSLVNQYRTCKMLIPLSSYSHRLLISFIRDARLTLIEKTINQRLEFKIQTRDPSAVAPKISFTSKSEQDSIARTNKKPVHWGSLQEQVDMETEGGKGKQTKEREVSTSRIPLPKNEIQQRKKMVKKIRERVALSPDVLPDVSLHTFIHSEGAVCSMDITNSAHLVAAGCSDSVILLWDMENNDEQNWENVRTTLHGHSGPVYQTEFSFDDRFLLSCSQDGTARLWAMEGNICLTRYRGHNSPVWDLAYSPVGYYFATAGQDTTARLWSTDRVYPLRIFAGHHSDVECVEFHPNCNYVGTGSCDKCCYLWDIQSGNMCRMFLGHAERVTALSFSKNGKYIATGDVEGVVRVFDIGSGKVTHELTGHETAVSSLTFAYGDFGKEANKPLLASTSESGELRFWDINKSTEDALASTLRADRHNLFFAKFTPSNLLISSGIYFEE